MVAVGLGVLVAVPVRLGVDVTVVEGLGVTAVVPVGLGVDVAVAVGRERVTEGLGVMVGVAIGPPTFLRIKGKNNLRALPVG